MRLSRVFIGLGALLGGGYAATAQAPGRFHDQQWTGTDTLRPFLSTAPDGHTEPQQGFGTSVAMTRLPALDGLDLVYYTAVVGVKENDQGQFRDHLYIYETRQTIIPPAPPSPQGLIGSFKDIEWDPEPVADFALGTFSLRPTVAITADARKGFAYIVTSPSLKRFALDSTGVWKEEVGGSALNDLQLPSGYQLSGSDRMTPNPVSIARGNAGNYYTIVGDPKSDRAFVWTWQAMSPNSVSLIGDGTLPGVIQGDLGTQFGYSVSVDTVYSVPNPSQVPVFAIGAPSNVLLVNGQETVTGQVFTTFISIGNPNQIQPLRTVVSDPQDYGLTAGARFGHAVDIAKSHNGAAALVAVSDTQAGEEVAGGITSRWTGRVHVARATNFANQPWVLESTLRDDGQDADGVEAQGPFGFDVKIAHGTLQPGDAIPVNNQNIRESPLDLDSVNILIGRPRDAAFDPFAVVGERVGFLANIQYSGGPFGGPSEVVDQATPTTLADAFVVTRNVASATWELSERLSAANIGSDRGFAGHSVAGNDLVVVLGDPLGSAYLEGEGAVYSFDKGKPAGSAATSILDQPELDRDANGRIDTSDPGRAKFQYGPDGRACEREIILLVDTSSSVSGLPATTRFDPVFELAEKLTQNSTEPTTVHIIGMTESFKDSTGLKFSDGYTQEYTNRVIASPRSVSGCIQCDTCADFIAIGVDRREPWDTNQSPPEETEGNRESWAGASSALAWSFPWRSEDRSIIVVTDTGACLGRLRLLDNCPAPLLPTWPPLKTQEKC